MRQKLPSVLLLTAMAGSLQAQTIEITPMVGYRFGGSLEADPGAGGGSESSVELELDDAAAFGVQLGYRVGDGEIELLYARQDTQLQTAGLFTGAPVFDLAFERMEKIIGKELSQKVKTASLAVYDKARDFAERKGIIIADTKMEFGMKEGKLILIDELLTPDSSRFWPKDGYQPGGAQSFDKQFLRDYLLSIKR